jgi:hypothetical protein
METEALKMIKDDWWFGKNYGQSFMIVGQQKGTIQRLVNTETLGWQIQKDIESFAFDENG